MKLNLILIFAFAVAFCSCAPFKKGRLQKDLNAFESTYQHHSGLVIYDLEKESILIDHNGDKYFTPASNVKILTLYTALQIIGDSIPGIYYVESGDSLIFWGTGDPSFLNDQLPESRVFDFLKSSGRDLYFSSSNFHDQHFGPGWAWDDYFYTFSSEKSSLPIYGNNFKVSKKRNGAYLHIEQPYFKQYFWLGDTLNTKEQIVRDVYSNHTVYFPSSSAREFDEQIPFRYSDLTLSSLLSDTLNRKVTPIMKELPPIYKTLYSIRSDSAYRVMMQESDNFIAEQLMLVVSGILSDSLQVELGIEKAKPYYSLSMPDEPVWVDGSGLSRYNLLTPRSILRLWHELYKKLPQEELMHLLATGGQSGTLENYFKDGAPYIFGKTGTLSNNHNLSGFLKTKKGKLYIFAFMNNNYPTKAIVIKREMEQILQGIYLRN